METLPTNKGNLTAPQIIDCLQYSSYAANRGYGMTHEALVRIGIGNDQYKAKYEDKLETLLRYINNEMDELNDNDHEGYVWWMKFREFAQFVNGGGVK